MLSGQPRSNERKVRHSGDSLFCPATGAKCSVVVLSDRGNLLAAPRALRMCADRPALGDSPAMPEVDCFVVPPVKEVIP